MMFSSNNQWILIGVTSGGFGCARPYYSGMYTRVAAFQDWINSTMTSSYAHKVSTCDLSFFVLPLLFISMFSKK